MTQVIRTAAELQEKVAGWKRSGILVGVVPTMGALHDGHLSLARAARAQSDRVIVTIFVNPKQFNNPDDLAKKIAWAHAHPQEMTAMGQRARTIYEQRFNPQQNLSELIEIYRDAMAANAA